MNISFWPTFYIKGVCILIVMISICCKKQSPINLTENPDNFSKIFSQFWEKMNNQYVYWDRDNTNWNTIYSEYKPLFDNLTNSYSDKIKAVSYFRMLTANLIDGHFNITFQDPTINNLDINPTIDRKNKANNIHRRYNYDNVVRSYLDNGFLSGKGNLRSDGVSISATVGTINSNLLYFHCDFFALQEAYNLNDGNKVNQILNYFFATLKRKSEPIKGIILDLRNNTGGHIEDLNFFAGKLANQDITFGYSRSKTGLGKLNYSPWLESKLKHDPAYQVNVPIVLLGDNFSASLAEIMIIALRSKTNIFIGEQTYGATGPLSNADVFNSGSFSVGKFLTVKTSSVEFKGVDGAFYEGVGITPDVSSVFNYNDLLAGNDKQLELAISHLK